METASAKPELSVVLPALGEAKGLEEVLPRLGRVLEGRQAEILVIDDGSDDETATVAARHGARVIRHPYRKGNGAAVKRGIREAAGKVIVLMDADGQHKPEDLPALIEAVEEHDMAVGARTRGSGQKPHRWVANRLFSRLAGYLAGERVFDLTSGFRAIRADVARRFVELLPNGFSYPSTLTVTLARSGFTIAHVPIVVEPRRKEAGRSKIKPASDGFRFLLILAKVGVGLVPFRVFFPLSLVFLLLGAGWYAYTFITRHRFTNMSALLLCTAVIIFMLGLVADQIAQLRRERRDE